MHWKSCERKQKFFTENKTTFKRKSYLKKENDNGNVEQFWKTPAIAPRNAGVFEQIIRQKKSLKRQTAIKKTVRWGTLRCFRKFRVPQNFMHKKGISLNSVEKFLSHSAEKFREGILFFLRKFLVSKSFMDEKGGITFFRRKILVSQCRKISWVSLQCFRKFGVSKNFMHNRGITIFCRKFFVSQCRKTS